MRIDRFTQKMQEALQAAQDRASKAGHAVAIDVGWQARCGLSRGSIFILDFALF